MMIDFGGNHSISRERSPVRKLTRARARKRKAERKGRGKKISKRRTLQEGIKLKRRVQAMGHRPRKGRRLGR